jgi:phage terminase large subunit-like protein
VRVWDPEGKDIDLEETIAKEVQRLHEAELMIGPFNYDSYQMHQVAVNLRKKEVPCVEFSQQTDRTKSDTFLWKQFHTGKLQ